MAFNPFNSFRKHKKIGFAILTIVCMFMFVLSSGLGGGSDFFDQIGNWFGVGKGRGKDVIELYGDTVTEREVQELSEARQMANDFLLASLAEAQKETTTSLSKKLTELRKPSGSQNLLDFQLRSELDLYVVTRSARLKAMGAGGAIGQYRAGRDLAESFPTQEDNFAAMGMQGDFQAGMARFQAIQRYEQRSRSELYADIFRAQTRLAQLKTRLNEAKRTSDANLIDSLIAQLMLDAWLLNPERQASEYVLGGSPTTESLLDFMVWQRQAEKLGITIREDDCRKEVNRLVGRDVLTGDPNNDKDKMRKVVGERKNQKPVELKDFYNALCREMEVALAQAILLGRGPGIKAHEPGAFDVEKAAVTPGEFYDYFRQQRTSMDLLVVPVPVSSVLALAQQNPKQEDLEKAFSPEIAKAIVALANGKPSEEEMKQLFQTYKTQVPEPWSSYPAFKQPRRVQVEWIKIPETPDPAYVKLATLANTGVFPAPDPWVAVFSEFDRQQRSADLARATAAVFPTPNLLDADPALAYRTSATSPESVASEVLAGGQLPTGLGTALSLAVSSQTVPLTVTKMKQDKKLPFSDPTAAIQKDRARRSAAIGSLIADGMAKIGTGVPWEWSATITIPDDHTKWTTRWYFLGFDTPMPSVDGPTVDRLVAGRIDNELASIMFQSNVNKMEEEIGKAADDPKKLETLVPELVKKYGFTKYTGTTARLLDMYAVEKEPTLKAMHDDYLKSRRGQDALTEDRFASLFFNALPVNVPFPSQYNPIREYVFWKSKDVPASEPKSLTEPEGTRKLVEDAWRFQKARAIAEMIANSIQKDLNAKAKEDKLSAKIAEASKKGVAGLSELEKKIPEVVARRASEDARKTAQTFFDKAFVELTDKYKPLKFNLGAPFPLERVANKNREELVLPGFISYKAWKAPQDKMPYPPGDFISRLLKINPGEVAVVADLPQENFYLVGELAKHEPTAEQVVMEHQQASMSKNNDVVWMQVEASFRLFGGEGGGDTADPLWKEFLEERYHKTRKDVVIRLRQEAGKVDSKGRFVLNEGIKKDERSGPAE